MFLDFAGYKNFKVYQMDVKYAFLNGELEEEVYVEQPEGFLLSENRNHVCKLKKALYGLKQAPRAWFSILDNYLKKEGYISRATHINLYIKFENCCHLFTHLDHVAEIFKPLGVSLGASLESRLSPCS